ncbi:TPA: flavin-containing monooxygenase [Legionella feeleii]
MHKIAIIGAGPSGLTSTVAAIKEGLAPTLFERSYRLGGVWGPDKRGIDDASTAWPGMRVNISRHTGTFSDFSWPKEASDFPTTQEVYDYLCHYARHHKLEPYIQFNSQIIQIVPKDRHWLVRWQTDHKQTQEACFDSVLICTSKFSHPFIPPFQGLETLKDNMLHSAKYRGPETFKDKTVLVVGGSLSGTSIAEELAKMTSVIHLIRKERWMVKRYRSCDPQNNGPLLPRDLLKSYADAQEVLSNEEQYQRMLEHCAEQNECPEWRMYPHSPVDFVIADEYLHWVRSGKLKPVRGDIKQFNKTSVILQNGDRLDFDCVIFCTGYQRNLSFLPDALRLQSPLFEDTFPTDFKGIAFIGMYPGARGAVFPLAELQAELACAVFSGRYTLPSTGQMLKEIAETPTNRDEVQFTISLAERLGIAPNPDSFPPGIRRLLIDGAYTPARFRLTGTHSNPAMALDLMKETERHRRQLLRSKNKE